jgi:hypothetical protein
MGLSFRGVAHAAQELTKFDAQPLTNAELQFSFQPAVLNAAYEK